MENSDENFNILINSMKEYNENLIKIWDILSPLRKEKKYSYLYHVKLKNQFLVFNFCEKNLLIDSLGPFFKDINNFFNDPVPKEDYFSLLETIKKLETLNPSKGLSILISYHTAFENVFNYLNKIYNNYQYISNLPTLMIKKFHLDCQAHELKEIVWHYKKKKAINQ